ncbi:MAG TPA: phosphotransferase family protein [Acidimicrobiales bacterium]|nr:phosphotransferase family protein [Acidimicrobiales bacterium]
MSSVEPLRRYLSSVVGEDVDIDTFDRVEGGWSRQTHRVVVSGRAGRQVLALRGEIDVSVLDTDLEREWRVMVAVDGSSVPMPRLFGFEGTRDVLGYRFITMGWIDGEAPNPWRRASAARLRAWADRAELGPTWIDDIARLHLLDPGPVRAAGVDPDAAIDNQLERELGHWVGMLRATTHHPGALVEEACGWLEDNRPPPAGRTAIVHGDLRIGNMLIRCDRVVAFLDWEMAGLGDWRVDLGYCLMPYHAGKLLERILPSANGLMHPATFVDRYLHATGAAVGEEELTYFIVLGCLKMIAILCTGIDKYMAGRTKDPRLAWNSIAVPGLVDDVCRLIDRGRPW